MIRSNKLLLGLPAVLILIVTSACTSYVPYRTGTLNAASMVDNEGNTVWPRIETSLLQEPCDKEIPPLTDNLQNIELGFVEIDEQGSAWDREQSNAVLRLIDAHTEAQTTLYVVVFVHGWRNDVRWGNENVCKFKNALALLRKTLNERSDKENPKIVGVSIGWRGQSIDLFPLDLLTVYDRKSTSEEIGRGALVELLVGIESRVKGTTRSERGGSANKLLLVGHSFGASVLHNALGPILVERLTKDVYQRSKLAAGVEIPPDEVFLQGFGDLVILVNPAIEAIRFIPLLDLVHSATVDLPRSDATPNRFRSFKLDPNQPPRLVVLSSLGDVPTRKVFPVIRAFQTYFEKHRKIGVVAADGKESEIGEWELDVTTIGNEPMLATHESMTRTAKFNPEHCPALANDWLSVAINDTGEFTTGRGWKNTFPGSNIVLKHNRKFAASLPIWIMPVSTDIIKNHKNIVGDGALVCLFDQLLGTSAQKKKAEILKLKTPSRK